MPDLRGSDIGRGGRWDGGGEGEETEVQIARDLGKLSELEIPDCDYRDYTPGFRMKRLKSGLRFTHVVLHR